MRKVLILGLLACSFPAQAQMGPPAPSDILEDQPDVPAAREIDLARDNIHEGRKDGSLSKSQARNLKKHAARIDAVAERYARDGLSQSEQRDLSFQSRALESLTNAERFQKEPKQP
ncbi:hypothetical protein GRI39_12080 [Altererythrobacter indicus]|uniref:DUF4148 domain-containing protein n=1 Tax=Altericroceibacterium indicum TaxID=374177 RepID=A0A845AAR0_9SPHN|nr:hypothetical protein [Altericroceibacterium indicum]MXP26774.1 hypothetical protein [Altericroceibacterium indicum]